MPRGKMSPESRAKIAAGQRRRWAKARAAKAAGQIVSKPGRKPGRPIKAPAVSLDNRYLSMTISQLVEAKRQIDEAWRVAGKLIRQ